jgi:hypothetical protein
MSKLNSLFNSNRFLLVVSFVLSVVTWFAVSIFYSPQVERTLSQVPVEISFGESDAGYQAYSDTELVAKVEVSGKKYVVEQLANESIVVSATVDSVSSSGMHTLNLQARKKNVGDDYTVVSVTPATINVMIDVHRDAMYDVGIDCVGATVPELKNENQSLLLEPTFVDEAAGKITVSGPESEVRRIAYVHAVASVNKELDETENFTAGIVAYDDENTVIFDANNNISSLNYVDFSYATTEISANVNLRKVVPLTYEVIGAPASKPTITLEEITGSEATTDNQVDTIGIKGAVDVISLIDEVRLDGTVDFTKIDPTDPNTSRFELKLPSVVGVTYDEYANLTDLYFVATVDTKGMISRSFDVAAEDVVVQNLSKELKIKVQSALKGVTVVGPQAAVEDLSVEDIKVTVDALSVTAAGASNLTPTVTVNKSSCFIFGTYQVVAEATAK